MRVPGRRWRPVTAAAVTAVLLGGLSACGSSGLLSPPTGVDGLVVPTPSPRPADFVLEVDNPWLAWTPGAVTTYEQTGAGGATAPAQMVTVAVAEQHRTVAGLSATVVTTTVPGRAACVDFFAQDRDGNVWWLGREGAWTADADGAEAGLWMPAAPRVGDGFRQAALAGVVDDVATVLAAPAADGTAPAFPEVRLEVSSVLEPGALVVRTYVEGSGLARELRSGSGAYLRTAEPS